MKRIKQIDFIVNLASKLEKFRTLNRVYEDAVFVIMAHHLKKKKISHANWFSIDDEIRKYHETKEWFWIIRRLRNDLDLWENYSENMYLELIDEFNFFLDPTDTRIVNNFDIFEDRVKSLLVRWKDYSEKNPHIDSAQIIKLCLNEINDDFTKSLINENMKI